VLSNNKVWPHFVSSIVAYLRGLVAGGRIQSTAMSAIKDDEKIITWSWQDDHGGFAPYDPISSAALEQAYQNGDGSYETPDGRYFVDLSSDPFTQRNKATRFVRHVRRDIREGISLLGAAVDSKDALEQHLDAVDFEFSFEDNPCFCLEPWTADDPPVLLKQYVLFARVNTVA